MNDSPETPGEPLKLRHDFEDRHFHDDDELVPVDDVRPRATGLPAPGRPRPARRPPPRRRSPDDD